VTKSQIRAETRQLRKIVLVNGFPQLYQVSHKADAGRILVEGFEERWYAYTTGAWLSNRPLDFSCGPGGDTLLLVTFKVKFRELARFDCTQPGLSYREFVVPSAFIAEHAMVERGDLEEYRSNDEDD
jgi:hypothetical protein